MVFSLGAEPQEDAGPLVGSEFSIGTGGCRLLTAHEAWGSECCVKMFSKVFVGYSKSSIDVLDDHMRQMVFRENTPLLIAWKNKILFVPYKLGMCSQCILIISTPPGPLTHNMSPSNFMPHLFPKPLNLISLSICARVWGGASWAANQRLHSQR